MPHRWTRHAAFVRIALLAVVTQLDPSKIDMNATYTNDFARKAATPVK
ncbi:hypothetical protein [Paraburkholderia sartisoli]|uniref:NitT/TauT family transport system substrate-binding protein n=1 Tax=Paraburkholderia sartisoli TaxID=83784 RepID=A0A1H4HTJ2_9BURK|nr:hypothetical protein [Paraburkholderia sartisoli]SEB25075.1 NitT/TauT family transport system substrate-binding protein [Paraburkholderia sartisoli]